MNRRGFGSLVIILIVILAVVVIGGIWYYKINQTTYYKPTMSNVGTTTVPTPIPPASSSVFSNAQTYTNEKYGFSFQYPASGTWAPLQSKLYYPPEIYTVAANGGSQIDNDFANQNGAVTLGEVSTVDPFDQNNATDLAGAEFGVSVNPGMSSSTCNQLQRVLAPGNLDGSSTTQTINGISYSLLSGDTTGISMNSEINYNIFHTFQHGVCYEFVLEIDTSYGYYPPAQQPQPEDTDQADFIVNAFMSGVSYFSPTANP